MTGFLASVFRLFFLLQHITKIIYWTRFKVTSANISSFYIFIMQIVSKIAFSGNIKSSVLMKMKVYLFVEK